MICHPMDLQELSGAHGQGAECDLLADYRIFEISNLGS
jgi:hypothetical protein